MDNKTIEDEVYDFIDEYFDEELALVETNLDFIEDNQLLTPTIDYTALHHYLSDILLKFKMLDTTFVSSTISKLNDDIKNMNEAYNQFLKKTSNPKEIFKSNFIPTSLVLQDYAQAILDYQNSVDKSADDFVHIKHMKQNLIKLKEHYYPIFEDIFFDNKKNIQNDFRVCLNTKMFYFDRVIWDSASKSEIIVKHMKIRKMEGDFSAKTYLRFIMSMMRPYTEEYKYLEKCLKVYK